VPGAGLRRLGKVLHLSKSGNLIVRVEKSNMNPPRVGTEVYDTKLEKIGIVNNVLGPVGAPYLSLTPGSNIASEKTEGRIVYLLEKR